MIGLPSGGFWVKTVAEGRRQMHTGTQQTQVFLILCLPVPRPESDYLSPHPPKSKLRQRSLFVDEKKSLRETL